MADQDLSPNERKTIRQQEILSLWLKAKARGYVLAATGFGKSRLGGLAISRCFESDPNRIVHIVVPSEIVLQVWEDLKGTLVNNQNIHIYIVNTYVKLTDSERACDLLILDECHRYSNESAVSFSTIIDKTEFRWTLCLSATLSTEQEWFLMQRNIPKIAEITLEEAETQQFVSAHHLYVVRLPLTTSDEDKYQKMTKEFNRYFKLFGFDFDRMKNMLSNKGLRDEFEIAAQLPPGTGFGLLTKAFKLMRDRKLFLQTPECKIDAVETIVKMFPNSKILTFSEATSFADRITERLGEISSSYHTGLATRTINGKKLGKKKLLAKALSDFNSGAIRVMNTAKAMDEGADIQGVDVAIIASYTSTPRQLIQRIGRAVRYLDGKVAYIFILNIHSENFNTQENRWLKSALKGTKTPVWIDSLEEVVINV